MIDPPQLKVASRHGISRLLLQSAIGDQSAVGARDRALQVLNLSAGIAAGTVAVNAAASTSTALRSVQLLVVKWLGLGVLAGTATLATVDYALHTPPQTQVVPAPPARNLTRVVSAAQPAPIATRPAEAASEQPIPAPPHDATPHGASPAKGEATGQSDERSVDLLQALHEVRSALAAREPNRALQLLAAFQQRSDRAALAEEAAVLRIDALLALGRPDARAAGRDFLRDYPHSAYAVRVRTEISLP